MIESGRYTNPPIARENRTCPLCKNNDVENEYHFLFQCQSYSDIRRNLFNNISKTITNFNHINSQEKAKEIFKTKDDSIYLSLGKFILNSFKIRTNTLENAT